MARCLGLEWQNTGVVSVADGLHIRCLRVVVTGERA